jgi:hypothetical protein
MYYVNNAQKHCRDLEKYNIDLEDSVQKLLGDNPQILLNIDGLAIPPFDKAIAIREYRTQRGPIDIVYITDNGDIILVETKLLKNPESHRTVVAQAIDYAKAFANEDVQSLKDKISNNGSASVFDNNKNIDLILATNIKAGNYQVLIVGDEIHSNILGMVDAIQSAPHLSFTLSAISLNPFKVNDDEYIVFPEIESRTVEVERSVISIEILDDIKHKIVSSSPSTESKGNKPKINEEIFLDNIEKNEFIEPMKYLWEEIAKRGGSIDWWTLGFSGGYRTNNKRTSLIWAYNTWFNILTPKYKKQYDISDESYNLYLDDLKKSEYIYENIIVPNKSMVGYSSIKIEDLKIAIDAVLNLMDRMMQIDEAI